MDQDKWLEKMFKELAVLFRRLGINVTKGESLRKDIDQLCQVVIQHHLLAREANADKLRKLAEYSQEEKDNNQRLLMGLKAKEQALSKKLNTIQTSKGNTHKK